MMNEKYRDGLKDFVRNDRQNENWGTPPADNDRREQADKRLRELERVLPLVRELLSPDWDLRYTVTPTPDGQPTCTLTLSGK